jgi:hypothetical protein
LEAVSNKEAMMGAVGANLILRRGSGLLAGLVAVLLLLVLGAGSARAATCSDNWTGSVSSDWFTAGNWSTSSVPTSSTDVCISNSTVNIDGDGGHGGAVANSLTLSGSTLNIAGGTDGTLGSLELANGGSIDPTSSIVLTELCSSACSAAGSSLTVDAGTLTNQGTITSAAGTNAGSGRAIYGNATNQGGTILVNAPLTWSGGAVDNQGEISLPNASTLTLGCCSNTASLTNDTGGQITNNGGSGYVSVGPNATFTQGAGAMNPSSMTAHPAVIVDNSGFLSPAPTLAYTGTAASAIEARGTVNLSGNLAAGQSLLIDAVSGCPGETLVTAGSGFTNAGTITLAGTCDSGLKLTGGTLMNTGTLMASATPTNISREINGSLDNSGTLAINGATAFDDSGASLTQTAGTTTIANGAILDISASGATFQLQGGVLTGGGQSQATEAIINGPVSNSGGNIIPGGTSSPGLMTFDGTYTQGPGGELTEVVDGAGGASGVGSGYSQLGATGDMTLGGTLAISTLAQPTVGDLDTILATNGSRNGAFSTVTGTFTPGSSFGYRTTYGSDFAALEVGGSLTVRKAGPGAGTVTSSPAGINCGSGCSALFFQSQPVTLTAHPARGSTFGGWSGGCSGSGATCQVTMSQARTVTARFVHATSTSLSASRNPARVGKRVTYTARISPHPGSGTVRFTSGGSTISGCGRVAVNAATGKATCSVTYHSKGTHKIMAAYSGNARYGHSMSSKLTERVKR